MNRCLAIMNRTEYFKVVGRMFDEIAYADDLGGKEGIVSYTRSSRSFRMSSRMRSTPDQYGGLHCDYHGRRRSRSWFYLRCLDEYFRAERELATIKVLGFFDREVHLYVNKETMILTAIGIVCGIPLGYAFAQTLTYVLNMPSIYLAVSLHGEKLCHGGRPLIFVCDPGGC